MVSLVAPTDPNNNGDVMKQLTVCVARHCVKPPIGDTKHGWCPYCRDCIREMLVPDKR